MKSTASEPGLSASARIVCLVPKFSHHTPAILNLHCVPVPYRIQFKMLQPVNWALCLPKEASKVQESGSYNIISKTSCEFKVPKTKYKTLENRAFARVGPSVWNTLPSADRSTRSVQGFKQVLKTFLFRFLFRVLALASRTNSFTVTVLFSFSLSILSVMFSVCQL